MCRPGDCVNLTLLITAGLFLLVLLSRDHQGGPQGLGGLGPGARLRLPAEHGSQVNKHFSCRPFSTLKMLFKEFEKSLNCIKRKVSSSVGAQKLKTNIVEKHLNILFQAGVCRRCGVELYPGLGEAPGGEHHLPPLPGRDLR